MGVGKGAVSQPVSYTHLRAHETVLDLVCRLLLEKKKTKRQSRTYQQRLEKEDHADDSNDRWTHHADQHLAHVHSMAYDASPSNQQLVWVVRLHMVT